MANVIDPAADGVWESVGTIYTKEGTFERMPANDDEWNAVKAKAITLVEVGNLLMLPERSGGNAGMGPTDAGDDRAEQARDQSGRVARQGRDLQYWRRHLRGLRELPQAVRPGHLFGQVARVVAGVLRMARCHRRQHRAPRVALHVPAGGVDARTLPAALRRTDGDVGPPAARPRLHVRLGVGDERSRAAARAHRLRRDGDHRHPALLRHSRADLSERVVSRQGDLPDPRAAQHLVFPLARRIRRSPDVGHGRAAAMDRAARGAGVPVLWALIIVFGRFIAYNWFDCDIQPQSAFVNWFAGCVVPPVTP